MNKEYCLNCKSEINQGNWKIGHFKCKKCQNEEIEIDVDELIEKVIKILNEKYKNQNS